MLILQAPEPERSDGLTCAPQAKVRLRTELNAAQRFYDGVQIALVAEHHELFPQ